MNENNSIEGSNNTKHTVNSQNDLKNTIQRLFNSPKIMTTLVVSKEQESRGIKMRKISSEFTEIKNMVGDISVEKKLRIFAT